MNLFVYSDESGVFDSIHNDYFVFGGVLFMSKQNKDIAERQYRAVERSLRESGKYEALQELKASVLSNRDKGKIMRSLNNEQKFAVIIDQKKVLSQIFYNKKDKQRYLDYAYKIALKKFLLHLSSSNILNLESVEEMFVYCDEHATATSGKYELEEGLLAEYKNGTYNTSYQVFFPPATQNLKNLCVEFCASEKKTLIRAADIVANHVYSCTVRGVKTTANNLYITRLP